MIDYAIHYVKANQGLKAKVFKLKTIELKKGESVDICKQHAFREITTRKYYPGKHAVELLINGKPVAIEYFTLSV